MDKAKKSANSGQYRNYQQEAGMESRVNAGEQSYAKAGTEGKDKSKLNTIYLLETILERGNLNEAYKRVKQNNGSPGVDNMKVEALLPFLRQHGESLKQSLSEGYKTIVDIDLERFFDRVNHDKLMYLLSLRIGDKRLLKLIRGYLESGVMIGGLFSPSDEGTPQGGPLSPLLSNVMLHELDKELDKRGHRFCRYADDCNIYVKSKRSGKRVIDSIRKFIEEELQLKGNQTKSAVDSPTKRKFLGFSFYYSKDGVKVKLHAKTLARIKAKVKTYTKRSNGKSIDERIADLDLLIKGWVNYYKIADMRKHCQRLDEWMRRRLRMCIWNQWKKIGSRHKNLVKLGIRYYILPVQSS